MNLEILKCLLSKDNISQWLLPHPAAGRLSCENILKNMKLIQTRRQSNYRLKCIIFVFFFFLCRTSGKAWKERPQWRPWYVCLCVCVIRSLKAQSRTVEGIIQSDISKSRCTYNHVKEHLYIFGGQNRLYMCNLWPGGFSVGSDCFSLGRYRNTRSSQ